MIYEDDDAFGEHLLELIEQGKAKEILERMTCPEGCPCRSLIVVLDAVFRASTQVGLAKWIARTSHEPSCGYDQKGDLVRWVNIDGHSLPTVRIDLVEQAVQGNIRTPKGELISALAASLHPKTRAGMAGEGAALQ